MLTIATTSISGQIGDKLAAAASAGFEAIELYQPDFEHAGISQQTLKAQAADLGLRLLVLQPCSEVEGLPPPLRQAAFDRVERQFDLMQALGIPLLLMGASKHAQTVEDSARMIDDLSELAERAASRGLSIAYLASPWARHIQREMQAYALVKGVGRENFGLALNSFFSLADGGKPARLREIDGKDIAYVQLSDGPRSDQDIRHLKRELSLLPGQGDLHLQSFVQLIAKNGYCGPYAISRAQADLHSDAMQFARDGYRAIVSLLDSVWRSDTSLPIAVPPLGARSQPRGIEFIEFAVDEQSAAQLRAQLQAMCFRKERVHISKPVELWRQGAINILVNQSQSGFAHERFTRHGPSVCDMAIRVDDAAETARRAAQLGTSIYAQSVERGELMIPAVEGVCGGLIHFIDERSDLHRLWDIEFKAIEQPVVQPAGLRRIDHIAQVMKYEQMQSWVLFFLTSFDMHKTPVLELSDPSGIVSSQAVQSTEAEVRLTINGAASKDTYAGAFMAKRGVGGVQHIALLTDDIFESSARLAEAGFERLAIPADYYQSLRERFALDPAYIDKLQAQNILYSQHGDGRFLQIYATPIFGGFFFEIVQRQNGYNGYGSKNAATRLAAQQAIH